MGASGGDMAMTADASRDLGLTFAPFPADSATQLQELLTDKVTVANPFDFHTHIWFDGPAMRSMFGTVHRSGFDVTGFMLDCPPEDQADPAAYIVAIDQYIASFPGAPARGALISSLPESMSATTRERCLAVGIMPLQGQREALEALDLAGAVGEAWSAGARVELRIPSRSGSAAPSGAGASGATGATQRETVVPRVQGEALSAQHELAPDVRLGGASQRSATTTPPDTVVTNARSLTEHQAKETLAAFGVRIPRSLVVASNDAPAAAQDIGLPVVMKATGAHLEHKSEVGAVVVGIRTPADAKAAADRLSKLSDHLLVEEMIADGVAEILVGMTVDPQFGQVLLLGAGGVMTELLRDTVTLLPPFTAADIESALNRLKVSKLLAGFRGKPAGDVPALVATVLACTRYAEANLNSLLELDINPVIVRPIGLGAVAVDALIRLTSPERA
jgi:acetyl-CoA synthetase